MEKAYIILAHKNARQVKRLIERLDDKLSTFFIHVDAKVNPADFEAELSGRSDTHFVSSVATDWGQFGLVKATLNALKAVKNIGKYFNRIILMSGQDYPIKNNQQINEFFEASPYEIFIDHSPLPNHDKWSPNGGLYRVNKYFFGFGAPKRLAAKAANFFGIVMPPFQRKLPANIKPFQGSQWWVINMEALNYILDYVEENPSYVSFHKSTFAPDELFFQMILLNTANKTIQNTIANDHLRFMKWPDQSAPSPELLLANDIQEIKHSDALFARKFDEQQQSGILNLIDNEVLSS